MSIKLSGKNSPIGREKSSEKRIKWESFLPMKKCLILTGSITVKMIVYGPLIGSKQIEDVEQKQQRVATKSSGMVSPPPPPVVCSEGVAPVVLFEKVTLDHHRYIKKVVPVARWYGNSKFGNKWTFEQDNGTWHIHQERQERCSQHFPSFIDKGTWTANSADLNPLDYCICDEFGQAINWDNVTSTNSLIAELKRGEKKIRFDFVREKVVPFVRIVCIEWHKTMEII